jgi:hypothetical protein
MPKAKAEGNGSLETVVEPVESAETEALDEGSDDRGDMVATVATVAVVGVAAAAFEVALLPGIILGVAAVAVPRYFCCSPRTIGHGQGFPRAAMNSRGERYPRALCGCTSL